MAALFLDIKDFGKEYFYGKNVGGQNRGKYQ